MSENIEERAQLKRSLLDLKHSEAKCLIEKNKAQASISDWKAQVCWINSVDY